MRSFHARQSSFVRHLIFVPVLALALALLVAACGTSAGVATVDGEAVTFDEVAALLPPEGDTVDPTLFARSLMLVIAGRVMMAEAERQFGFTATDDEIEAKVGELVLLSGQTEEEILTTYNLTTTSLRAIGAQQLMADKIIAELVTSEPEPTEEELRARYETLLPSATEVCSSHILLESPEEAEAALERALAGEDFGVLAMELSVGPSGPDGGDLGCSPPDRYVGEFAAATLDAEVGIPYGPVATQFGWHVILVASRTVPSFEDVRALLVEEIRSAGGAGLWNDWMVGILKSADVTVEPEYGTWTTDPAPDVIPPSP